MVEHCSVTDSATDVLSCSGLSTTSLGLVSFLGPPLMSGDRRVVSYWREKEMQRQRRRKITRFPSRGSCGSILVWISTGETFGRHFSVKKICETDEALVNRNRPVVK
jgi:hypothetical protein